MRQRPLLSDPVMELARSISGNDAQKALVSALERNRDLMDALRNKLQGYRAQASRGNVTDWGYVGDVEHINQTLTHLIGEK